MEEEENPYEPKDAIEAESDPVKAKDEQKINQKLTENYYLEDNIKLLKILTENCHPILSDLLT